METTIQYTTKKFQTKDFCFISKSAIGDANFGKKSKEHLKTREKKRKGPGKRIQHFTSMAFDEMLDSFEHSCWIMLDGKKIA